MHMPDAPFTRGVGVNASRWLWMEWRQALPNWIVGPSRRFTGAARGRSWELFNFSSANGGVSQSDRLMQIPNPVHATPEKYVIGCCHYDGASAPSFRHALRQALTPTPRVNYTRGVSSKCFRTKWVIPPRSFPACEQTAMDLTVGSLHFSVRSQYVTLEQKSSHK